MPAQLTPANDNPRVGPSMPQQNWRYQWTAVCLHAARALLPKPPRELYWLWHSKASSPECELLRLTNAVYIFFHLEEQGAGVDDQECSQSCAGRPGTFRHSWMWRRLDSSCHGGPVYRVRRGLHNRAVGDTSGEPAGGRAGGRVTTSAAGQRCIVPVCCDVCAMLCPCCTSLANHLACWHAQCTQCPNSLGRLDKVIKSRKACVRGGAGKV